MQFAYIALALALAIAESMALNIPEKLTSDDRPNDFKSLRFHGFDYEADTCDFSSIDTSHPEHVKFIMDSPEWKACQERAADKIRQRLGSSKAAGYFEGVSTPVKVYGDTKTTNSSLLPRLGNLTYASDAPHQPIVYKHAHFESDPEFLDPQAQFRSGALNSYNGVSRNDHYGVDLYFDHIYETLRGCKVLGELDLECYTPIKRLVLEITRQLGTSRFSPRVSRQFSANLRELYERTWPMDLEATELCSGSAMYDKNCIFFSSEEYAEEVEDLYTSAENLMIDILYRPGSIDSFESRIASLKARLATLELIEFSDLSNESDIGDADQMVEDISVMIRESETFLDQRFDPARNEATGLGEDIIDVRFSDAPGNNA